MYKVFLLPALALVILVYFLVMAYQKDKKEASDRKAESDRWMKEQSSIRPSFVEFILNTGEIVRSRKYKAGRFSIGSYEIRETSREKAQDALFRFYKLGFFVSDKGITYPACQVLQAAVTED